MSKQDFDEIKLAYQTRDNISKISQLVPLFSLLLEKKIDEEGIDSIIYEETEKIEQEYEISIQDLSNLKWFIPKMRSIFSQLDKNQEIFFNFLEKMKWIFGETEVTNFEVIKTNKFFEELKELLND